MLQTESRSVVQDEGYAIEKRCLRCTKFFRDSQPSMCLYHPGQWSANNNRYASLTTREWTCCRSSTYDGDGCKKERAHIEDYVFSRTMAAFPLQDVNPEPPSKLAQKKIETAKKEEKLLEEEKQAKDPKELEEEKKRREELEDEYFIHEVRHSDTLTGLSLKYKCSEALIKKLNKLMFNEQLWGKKTILIPKTPANRNLDILIAPESEVQVKSRKMSNFRSKIGMMEIDNMEARFYLDESDWDVEKAVACFLDDRSWDYEDTKRKKEQMDVEERIKQHRNQYKSASSNKGKKAATTGLLADYEQL
eukprot:TRINITY_DN27037_c0_g1_i1.p1 TRINITY_DN27037_c0_g1~~TRINITY_DN27037_c0_g1_i1.p1  ORF type:complete len:319 (-),score=71.77 TRINITY_DN27037_c0_g1_i1:27-941(-)